MTAQALPLPQDDAHCGGDAPDAPDVACQLDHPGRYHGTLVPVGDADWYWLHLDSEPACAIVNVTGGSVANVTLSHTASLQSSVSTELLAGQGEVALALPTSERILLGFTPDNATGRNASFGEYLFDLEARHDSDLGSGDAGSGHDAGKNASTALTVSPGCFRGDLDPKSGDALDYYGFLGVAGQTLGLSLGGPSGHGTRIDLLSPSGVDVMALANGEANMTVLSETGTWNLVVSEPGNGAATSYLVGLTLGGPEKPCEPMCRTMSGG